VKQFIVEGMNYQPLLNPRGGHKLRISLKISQVSNRNSPSFCEKMVIPFFNRATLDGWKYLKRKYCFKSSQLFMEWKSA